MPNNFSSESCVLEYTLNTIANIPSSWCLGELTNPKEYGEIKIFGKKFLTYTGDSFSIDGKDICILKDQSHHVAYYNRSTNRAINQNTPNNISFVKINHPNGTAVSPNITKLLSVKGEPLYIKINNGYLGLRIEKDSKAKWLNYTQEPYTNTFNYNQVIPDNNFNLSDCSICYKNYSSLEIGELNASILEDLEGWKNIYAEADSFDSLPPDNIFGSAYKGTTQAISATFGETIVTWTINITNANGNALRSPIYSLSVSGNHEDATKYYIDNTKKFVLPNNLSFLLRRLGSTSPVSPDDLYFYRDSDMTIKLDTDCYVENTGDNHIYFRHKNYTYATGSYEITFVDNEVEEVEIINQNEITFYLGNKLETIKDSLTIKATYLSGLIDNDFSTYSFINNDFLLSVPQQIKVLACGKEITLIDNNSIIEFYTPNISYIEINTSDFITNYVNKGSGVDVRPISFKVYYENAEYVQEVNNYNPIAENLNSTQFSVICDDLDNSFTYDGDTILNLDTLFENTDSTEVALELEFTLINIFNNDTLTKTQNISILDIVDVIGLSLVNAYQNYNIGNSFLDNYDNTEIRIYYKSPNNETKNTTIRLNSGFSAINIFPNKGTIFNEPVNSKTIKVTAATNNNVCLEYVISVDAKYNTSDIKSHNLRVVYTEDYTLPKSNNKFEGYVIVDEENTFVENDIRQLLLGKSINNIKVYGYLSDVGDTTKNARVVLFEDYIQPTTGESNIVVKFPCYVMGNAEYINKCHFGHLFGNSNAKNRLFLSGNNDLPNCDWHSGAINTNKQSKNISNENGDFTYFEDMSYCFYGQTDNRVVGYDIVSNDKMVVLKSKSDKEPTIYYRTNGLIQAIDGAGNKQLGLNNETLYQESYPLVIGNIGAGAINNKSIVNFNGDTLFLSSDKQIDGLDVTGIIGDSQRYANTRSYYINPLLKNVDLSNASFFTNNKYLFLLLKDYVLLTYFESFNSETSQYEWWRIDLKDVTTMIEIDEKIYFGNSNGKFSSLENGAYQDIRKIFIKSGGALIYKEDNQETELNEDNKVQVSSNVISQLLAGKEYYFKVIGKSNDDESYMYHQVATIGLDNSDIIIDSINNRLETSMILNEKETYYLNEIDKNYSSVINYGKAYRIEFISDDYYQLIDDSTNEVVPLNELKSATLCKRLNGEYLIKDVDYENFTFKLYDNNGNPLNLVVYGENQETTDAFNAEIKEYINIHAYYITAPITMGNLMYDKTIWGYTLTNDTGIDSSIEICQATNDIDFEKMDTITSLKSREGFSFEDLNFANTNFEKHIIPYKYTFYRPIKVPFICFGFRNYEADNAVLCSMQILYTMPIGTIGKF